jgi:hypothetical protein
MMGQNLTILHSVWPIVQKKLDLVDGDPMKLPISLQTVAIVETAQGIIDNGGFRYLFGSDFPNNPPYIIIINAYKRIGAKDIAEKLKKAIQMFQFENPHKHKNKRKIFMKSIGENSEFYQLEGYVCGNDSIWVLLDQYILNHMKHFTV